jgi:predicted dehydrogenase
MTFAALDAGKHVWCEKPMAPKFADAKAMRDAAARSGKVAIMGYNYIQNPAIGQIGALLRGQAIGTVNHVRVEMGEDFLADPEAPFTWRGDAASGYGAIDDFAVHALSLIDTLIGPVTRVMADMAKPFPDLPTGDGNGRRALETQDIACVLIRLGQTVSGTVQVNRAAWGRKGRLALQIFGTNGSILFDQERMNEFKLYSRDGPRERHGYRTILSGPAHPPYDRFVPAPGHGLGVNDLKIIEWHEFLRAIAGEESWSVDFDTGLRIERTVHAMATSFREERWIDIS